MQSTTFTTTRGGRWVRSVGGDRNYCALCKSFTFGPTWKWYHSATTASCVVCEKCAKEQS